MKIIKKSFLVFFLMTILLQSKAHPFYVSICQVDFNKENRTLEISVKTFADDLLLGLKNAGVTKLYLGEEKENSATDQYIFEYLKLNLIFKVNGKKVDYSFVGKEMETDVVWSYLEIEEIIALNEIEVECFLLTEVLETQSNIIQINNGAGIKSMLLTKHKTIDSITY